MKVNEIIREQVELNNKQKEAIVRDFMNFVEKKLHIKAPVTIEFSYDEADAQREHHTGSYNRHTGIMWVYMKDRNLVDILRTICHEFEHVKQGQEGRLHKKSPPGSKIEAEADATAGYLIKLYGANHHEIYQ